jgi:hypothetical protein
MGQISGVDAALITSIAGVAVANISYVGPTSAATLGLGGGGGGKLYTTISFNPPRAACMVGPSTENTQTLYYNSGDNIFYLDAGFITPFSGDGGFYYSPTDNSWAQISGEGIRGEIGSC